MKVQPNCEACIYAKQVETVAEYPEAEREAYLAEIRETLRTRDESDSAPYMVSCFKKVYQKHFGEGRHYTEEKKQFNDLLLTMEPALLQAIRTSADPLRTAILYARIGNYIDFAAVRSVDPNEFLALFDRAQFSEQDELVYRQLCGELETAKRFLLLCDNCGEVVLDKLFLQILHETYPQLMIQAMVRGGEATNDVTMEDALYVGLDRAAALISNGTDIAGTDVRYLSPEARQALEQADVILSKGQGNYESLNGYVRPVYYSFLCKCELFTTTFAVPQFTGMLIRVPAT